MRRSITEVQLPDLEEDKHVLVSLIGLQLIANYGSGTFRKRSHANIFSVAMTSALDSEA